MPEWKESSFFFVRIYSVLGAYIKPCILLYPVALLLHAIVVVGGGGSRLSYSFSYLAPTLIVIIVLTSRFNFQPLL